MVDKSELAIATSQTQNPIPFLIELSHIPHNIIVLQEVTREYLFNLRIITYGL